MANIKDLDFARAMALFRFSMIAPVIQNTFSDESAAAYAASDDGAAAETDESTDESTDDRTAAEADKAADDRTAAKTDAAAKGADSFGVARNIQPAGRRFCARHGVHIDRSLQCDDNGRDGG